MLYDFIVCLPGILFRSVSTDGVMQRFVEGGAVDKETNTWPAFNKILVGFRKKEIVEEVCSIKEIFKQLYDTFSELGKIPESVLMN